MTFRDNNTSTSPHDGIAISYQDSAKFKKHEFSLHHKGMCLKSRWSFEIGSELAVAIELPRKKVDFKGIVVGCRKSLDTPRAFDITVFFHEQTPELQKKIKQASPYFSTTRKNTASKLATV